MISIRAMRPDDIPDVKKLHNKFYSKLGFPDYHRMLLAFVIEDEGDEIILAGGVESTAEAVITVNQDTSRTKVGKALVQAQDCMLYTCREFNIRELYAFVQENPLFVDHLRQHGFTDCFSALSMRVPNGKKE